MKLGQHFKRGLTLAFALALVTLTGCSEKAPTGPNIDPNGDTAFRAGTSSSVEIYGRVAGVDATARTMTLIGNPTAITVSAGAEVVLKDSGSETPIDLGEINPGDSAEVRGSIQGDGSLLADRVRIRIDDSGQNEVYLSGRVDVIDPPSRSILLVGSSTPITVTPTAEVVQKVGGEELPIGLEDISAGDSLDIRGIAQMDGSVLADRVRLRGGEDFHADMEFTGVIEAIDYSNGTLMVSGHPETIMVDANTYIFMKVDLDDTNTPAAKRGADDGGDDDSRLHKPLSLVDLMVGDTVEVHADRVDASTLLAVAIEVEDGAFEAGMEIEFKDTIATIDGATGMVTFTNQMWNGTADPNALLTGLTGETITLADFAAGQLVEVRGFKTGANELHIVRMSRDNN